eukprot:GILI01047737.1.p2 GENE.GILI01047737.1~~GILI01047737.1.p2  ORF type:complete len:157 (-),score=33.44 GILI01047737.1:157-627(-)
MPPSVEAVDAVAMAPLAPCEAFATSASAAASAAVEPNELTAHGIASELVGMPSNVVEFVSMTLDRIAENPTREKLLKITQRLFRTHGAYVYYRDEERKLREREQLLIQHLRGSAEANTRLNRENQLLRRALQRIVTGGAGAARDRRRPPVDPKRFI